MQMEATTENEALSSSRETPVLNGLDINDDLEHSVKSEVHSILYSGETENIAGNESTKITSIDDDGSHICQVKTDVTKSECGGSGVSKKLTVHTYTVIPENYDNELQSCFIKSEEITSTSLTNIDSSRETGIQENYNENSFIHDYVLKEEDTRRTDGVLMTDVTPNVARHLFECEHCGKCFSVKSKLKKHRSQHSGENKVNTVTRSSTSKKKVLGNQASEGKSAEDQQTFLPGGAFSKEGGVLHSIKSATVPSSSRGTSDSGTVQIHVLAETHGSVECEMAFTETITDGESGVGVPTVKSEDSSDPYRNNKTTAHQKPNRLGNDTVISSQTEPHAKEEPYRCDKCGKGFQREKKLKKHVWVHNRGKPCKCEVCGKCFTYRSDVVRHMRAHTGEKPFKCDNCGKSFGVKSHLVAHLNMHSENTKSTTKSTNKARNSKCEICGKCYTQNSHLKVHMQIHTGEKPCSCTVCGKKFTKRNHLERHMKIHTKEVLFNCFLCGKGFSRKDHLKSHMQKHVGFICRHCDQSFERKSQLTIHMKTCNIKS